MTPRSYQRLTANTSSQQQQQGSFAGGGSDPDSPIAGDMELTKREHTSKSQHPRKRRSTSARTSSGMTTSKRPNGALLSPPSPPATTMPSSSSSLSWLAWLGSGIQKQTIHAAAILILAIGTSLWWNRRYDSSYRNSSRNGGSMNGFDTGYEYSSTSLYSTGGNSSASRAIVLSSLVTSICSVDDRHSKSKSKQQHHNYQWREQQDLDSKATQAHCHKAMIAYQTTLAVGKGMIPKSDTVLRIPRPLTIWDLDALRDPWIQREFVMRGHSNSSSSAHQQVQRGSDDDGDNNVGQEQLGSPLQSLLPSASIAPSLLAVYIARLLMRPNGSIDSKARSNHVDDEEEWLPSPGNEALDAYLSVLPQCVDDYSFHPLFWSDQDLEEDLGAYTSAYDHVMTMRRSVQAEYDALSQTSPLFSRQVNYTQYQIARLNVMTRSFGSGPWPTAAASEHDGREATATELNAYHDALGVDLSKGCHVMVPLLDQYNHHATPNVGFTYDFDSRGFVVTALHAIPNGAELVDSYGKRTDSDLLAKYGFVNGDGSDYTQASLALWHHVTDPSLDAAASNAINAPSTPAASSSKQWQMQMLRYMQYDDGYMSCVSQPYGEEPNVDVEAWELKRLKYQHLTLTGHLSNRWVVRMPPRDPTARPRRTIRAARAGVQLQASTQSPSQRVPSFDMKVLQFDATGVFSTCRLIVLTHVDYDGQALQMLHDNVHNASFVLPLWKNSSNEALEFRTLFCVARMAQTALSRFNVTIPQQLDYVASLADGPQSKHRGRSDADADADAAAAAAAAHYKNWTIAHVRLGEMQTLEALKQTAYAGLRQFASRIDSEPAFSMRDNPCPRNVLEPLLDR